MYDKEYAIFALLQSVLNESIPMPISRKFFEKNLETIRQIILMCNSTMLNYNFLDEYINTDPGSIDLAVEYSLMYELANLLKAIEDSWAEVSLAYRTGDSNRVKHVVHGAYDAASVEREIIKLFSGKFSDCLPEDTAEAIRAKLGVKTRRTHMKVLVHHIYYVYNALCQIDNNSTPHELHAYLGGKRFCCRHLIAGPCPIDYIAEVIDDIIYNW